MRTDISGLKTKNYLSACRYMSFTFLPGVLALLSAQNHSTLSFRGESKTLQAPVLSQLSIVSTA